jgi:hypothetical protein
VESVRGSGATARRRLRGILRIHGQEVNSFRRKTRSKALDEFKLHRQEKFLYICDTLHMWEWDVRVIDIQDAVEGGDLPLCLGGRGAAPPEFCGGPTGYRPMMKRQRESIRFLGVSFVARSSKLLE